MGMTSEALAQLLRGQIVGEKDRLVEGAQSTDKAGPNEVTFIADEKNLRRLVDTKAGVVIISNDLVDSLDPRYTPPCLILVDDAQASFIEVLQHFYPPRARATIGTSTQAIVSPSAEIGKDTNIYPGACIGDDVVIGSHCDIYPGVVIGAGCRIGNSVTLYAGVILYADVHVGDRVIIHGSAVLGADGFGYRLIDGSRQKVLHFGTVRIEDDVEIGAGTTIDRAMIGKTIIGEGTKIDNLVQIAHNCELGRHNVFVAQVALAGSVTSGDYVTCAGQVGVVGHVHLGERSTIGSKAGIHKDVPVGQTMIGAPAQPAADAMKSAMAQRKLPELRLKFRQLEKQVAKLTAKLESLSDENPPASASAA